MLSIVLKGLVIRPCLILARHLAVRAQEHFSRKSGRSAIHEHISSCKDCHSYSISNFYALAQANTDISAKVKEALYVNKYTPIK